MEIVVNEVANIGLTILCIVIGWMGIVWLDRNVFNKNRQFRKNKNND